MGLTGTQRDDLMLSLAQHRDNCTYVIRAQQKTFNFSCQAQHFITNPLNEKLVNVGLEVTFYLGIYTEI